MRIKAALYNADHLEYGLVTIGRRSVCHDYGAAEKG